MRADSEAIKLFKAAVAKGFLTTEQFNECISLSQHEPDIANVLIQKGYLNKDQVRVLRALILLETETQPVFESDLPAPSEARQADQQMIGKFRIIQKIGEGATGIIYKAKDAQLNRTVALKVMREGENLDLSNVSRFIKEAQIMANLRHANILTVYEAGTADNKHYFSMDLIEGDSLDRFISPGTLKLNHAISLIEKVARGVHFAHENGIVHRDLKPSNILIDKDFKPYVMDFGTAKILNAETRLTATGTIIGTPYYMAPEQVEGRIDLIDRRTDVYALGVILYEIATGNVPFYGSNAMDVCRKIISSDPPSIRSINRKVPIELQLIVQKAMDKNRNNRYQTACDFADDLRNYLAGVSISIKKLSTIRRAVFRIGRRAKIFFLLIGLAAALGSLAYLLTKHAEQGKVNKLLEGMKLVVRASDLISDFDDTLYLPDTDITVKFSLLDEAISVINHFDWPDGDLPSDACYQLGRAYFRKKDYANAEKMLNKAVGILADQHYLYERASLYWELFLLASSKKDYQNDINFKKAIEDFKLLVKQSSPESFMSELILLLVNTFDTQNLDEFIEGTNKLLEKVELKNDIKSKAFVLKYRAYSFIAFKNHDKALQDLDTTLKIVRSDWQLWGISAQVLSDLAYRYIKERKDPSKLIGLGIECSKNAIKINRSYKPAYSQITALYANLIDWQSKKGSISPSDYSKAIDACQNAISIDPDNLDVVYNKGLIHRYKFTHDLQKGSFDDQEYQSALSCFRKVWELDENWPQAEFEIGVIYFEKLRFFVQRNEFLQKEFDESLRIFKRMLEIGYKSDYLHPNIAAVHLARLQYEHTNSRFSEDDFYEIINHSEQGLKLNPDDYVNYVHLASAHYLKATYTQDKQDIHKAIEYMNKQIQFNANDANSYLLRGDLYLLSNESDKSKADWNKAVELDPRFESELINRDKAILKKKPH